jgi:hypothetical protein
VTLRKAAVSTSRSGKQLESNWECEVFLRRETLRVYRHIRGSSWPCSVAGIAGSETYVGRLWIWRGGRLENRSTGSRDESNGHRTKRRQFFHGRLYIHFDPANPMVLGAHMLEICESIAEKKPSCEIHPLGIGGKADPVRLVFNTAAGNALNASIVDLGNRFRLLVNEVEAVTPLQDLPKLPGRACTMEASARYVTQAARPGCMRGCSSHLLQSKSFIRAPRRLCRNGLGSNMFA